jgi:hypothetical protein
VAIVIEASGWDGVMLSGLGGGASGDSRGKGRFRMAVPNAEPSNLANPAALAGPSFVVPSRPEPAAHELHR